MKYAPDFPAIRGPIRRLAFLVDRFNELSWGRKLVILVPFIWLAIFFFIPFLVVFKISLSESALAVPPYTDLLEWDADSSYATLKLHLGNFLYILEDSYYVDAYLSSVKIAALTTILTLLIGFPIAYLIARSEPRHRVLLLSLVILPFWTSFLLRVYAWIALLKRNGPVNEILMSLGIIHEPLQILQTDLAVYIGLAYTYLPFMILPLYAVLEKLDGTLLEASQDLGAKPWQTFFLVTVPLSMPGILAGCALVFIPAVGEYVIPALLGGSDTLMIGRVLWDEFAQNRDWPMASAVASVMLVVIVGPIMLMRNRTGSKKEMAK